MEFCAAMCRESRVQFKGAIALFKFNKICMREKNRVPLVIDLVSRALPMCCSHHKFASRAVAAAAAAATMACIFERLQHAVTTVGE